MKLFGILLCVFSSLNLHAFGEDLPNLQTTESGLYRSGRPTYNGLVSLKNNLKVKTIIDLEEQPDVIQQEAAWAKQLGMNFISMPMSAFVKPNETEVNKIEELINTANLRPMLVHCLRGMDRTGLIIGLYRVETNKWMATRSYDEMLRFGFHPRFWELDNYFKARTKMR